jgi:hypothetical protein
MAQVLYVTGYSVTLYHTSRKDARALGRFTCNDAGYSELVKQLDNGEPKPVAILADLIEEEFREETLPHTIGRDRNNLHKRFINKLFRSTPFRYHRVVGRERDGRRDDRVLFSALTNRDNIEPLLAVLDKAAVPVKGIYSLPLITDRLLKPLTNKPGNVLIVTEQADGGLRETFIRNGRVHFSRLAPVTDSSPENYCNIIKVEASKTRRYLNSLRLLPPNQSLDIYVLCDSARFEALLGMPVVESDITIQPINLSQVASLVDYPEYPDTPFSDALFCYLLGKRLTANHYAPPNHLRNWQTYKAKTGLRAATWLLAVGTITLAGMNIVDSRLMEQETLQLTALTDQVRHDNQRAAQNLTVEPVAAIAMREALHIADRLNAYPVDLDHLFSLLGNGFSKQPDFVMDKFDWFVASSPHEHTIASMPRADDLAQVKDAPFLVANIHGHVRAFDGRYRQAHEKIDSIARWLEAQPGVRAAEVVTKPLNTRTDADLQGGIAAKGDKETATFQLRIVTELKHEST